MHYLNLCANKVSIQLAIYIPPTDTILWKVVCGLLRSSFRVKWNENSKTRQCYIMKDVDEFASININFLLLHLTWFEHRKGWALLFYGFADTANIWQKYSVSQILVYENVISFIIYSFAQMLFKWSENVRFEFNILSSRFTIHAIWK